MCELSVICGELARCGGVADPWLCSEGERAGEGASLTLGIGPNMFRRLSSSDGVLISTSFSKDAKKDGCASMVAAGMMVVVVAGGLACSCRWDGWDGPGSRTADDDDSPFWGSNRLVRGRFSFLSGSWCCSSCGSAVADRDLRFRDSISLAFSKAPQASRSSRVC